MIDVIRNIFGEYQLVDGQTNFEYIAAVLIFAIVLYSVFRILGLVLGVKK